MAEEQQKSDDEEAMAKVRNQKEYQELKECFERYVKDGVLMDVKIERYRNNGTKIEEIKYVRP